jgi:hypothetical protein
MDPQPVSTKKRSNILVFLIAGLIIVIIGIAVVALSKAAPGSSSTTTVVPKLGFYFNPTTSSVAQGSTINVQAMVNTDGNPVQGVTARIFYDNSKLELINASDITTGVDPFWEIRTRCSTLNTITLSGNSQPCKPAGEVVFVLVNSDPTKTYTGSSKIVVGNMTFKARTGATTGLSDITFDTSNKTTSMTNSDSAIQAILDTRTTDKGTYTIIKPKGKRQR